MGRLEIQTQTVNNIDFQILYGYNKNNELETLTYPSGRVVSYGRNPSSGLIQEMSTTYEENTTQLIQNMTRLPFGPITSQTLGNGLVQTQSFDQLYRLTGSQTGSIYNRTYTYNANHNITGIQDLIAPAKSQSFGYDDLNRLTSATGSYGSIGYAYDNVGNRLSLTKGTQVENYTYQANTNQLSGIDGTNPVTYSYDQNGNIIGMGPKALNYTPDNRLLEIQPVAQETDNLKSAYVYNHQGQRVQKKVYKFIAGDWQLLTADLFVYDIQGNLILEADQSGEIQKEYLYLEGNRVAQYGYDDLQMSQGPKPRLAQRGLKPQIKIGKVFDDKLGKKQDKNEKIQVAATGILVGLLLQVNPSDIYNEVLYYYLNDHLGTPQLMVDHEGLVVWKADYDPFGEASVDPGSTATNAHRMPGQYQDEETGLHYNYHRYYDPRSGRYITADPIGQAGGINLYPYVENNPVNYFDPLGLTLSSNFWFFHDWVHGTGAGRRTYGPGSVELQEMMFSPGADHMREAFKKGNCAYTTGDFTTGQGIIHTAWRVSSTAFQVGGFMYSATNNGDCTVTYEINNIASAYSFFGHLPFIKNRDRGALRISFGIPLNVPRLPGMWDMPIDNFANIYQTFRWTEKSPCCCEGGK